MKYLLITSFIFINTFAAMDFEKRGIWLNILPLGVGQYQNFENKKALVFFFSESTLLALTLGTAVITNGKEKQTNLEKMELASFSTFIGIYLWGIYDAFRNYSRVDHEIINKFSTQKTQIMPCFDGKKYLAMLKMEF